MPKLQINSAARRALLDYAPRLNPDDALQIGPDAWSIEVDGEVANALDDIAYRMGPSGTISDAILSAIGKKAGN